MTGHHVESVVAWTRALDNQHHQPPCGQIVGRAATTGEGAALPTGDGVLAAIGPDVARLFMTERTRLLAAIRRRIVDPEEAADLVQDAFVRLAQVSPVSALRAPAAYLQRIVRNLLRDRAKRAERRYAFCDLAAADAELPATVAHQEWAIEANDLMDQYLNALATLSPKTREVFLLHRVEELRYRDIAERLGITVATVEYHMTRALVQLDKAINQ